jgi:glucose-1-phosphate adenylyltransferase
VLFRSETEADADAPPIGIGVNCRIEGAIIDKNARLGADVVIRPFPRGTDIAGDNWAVQDGIVVIPKGAVIAAGTHIEPGK